MPHGRLVSTTADASPLACLRKPRLGRLYIQLLGSTQLLSSSSTRVVKWELSSGLSSSMSTMIEASFVASWLSSELAQLILLPNINARWR